MRSTGHRARRIRFYHCGVFEVDISESAVVVTMTGWDRAMNWRRHVAVESSAVLDARVEQRSTLERRIDHRASGLGTHNGEKRPNRRRVGTMLGRDVAGKQFWAVPAGDESTRLLVVEVRDGRFKRLVLAVDDPVAAAAEIRRSTESA